MEETTIIILRPRSSHRPCCIYLLFKLSNNPPNFFKALNENNLNIVWKVKHPKHDIFYFDKYHIDASTLFVEKTLTFANEL